MQTEGLTTAAPTTLGQRLRAARKLRGFSQDDVAGSWFSKSYISAVERNKVNPSLKALRHIAERLEVPIYELLSGPIAIGADGQSEAPSDYLAFQLDHAGWLIEQNQAGEALAALNEAEATYGENWEQFTPQAQFQFQLLRSLAYLRTNDPGSAREAVTTATRLAQQFGEASEEAEQASNLLGLVYFQQDSLHMALHQHTQGLEAIRKGAISDTRLKLDIFNNLANDYMALGDNEQAVAVLNELLQGAAEGANLTVQASNYWQTGMDYRDSRNAEQAKLHRAQALTLVDTAHNLEKAAQARLVLAKLELRNNNQTEAERLLNEATRALPHDASKAIWSAAYELQAELALKQGRLEQAGQLAQQSLDLATTAYEDRAALDDAARAEVLKAYGWALRTSALHAEANGEHQQTDDLLARSIEVLESAENSATLADVEYDYAELLRERGQHEAAGSHYHRAYAHRQRRR